MACLSSSWLILKVVAGLSCCGHRMDYHVVKESGWYAVIPCFDVVVNSCCADYWYCTCSWEVACGYWSSGSSRSLRCNCWCWRSNCEDTHRTRILAVSEDQPRSLDVDYIFFCFQEEGMFMGKQMGHLSAAGDASVPYLKRFLFLRGDVISLLNNVGQPIVSMVKALRWSSCWIGSNSEFSCRY